MTTAAVIGLGDISALHLDAIADNPDIELVAVCDLLPERAARVAADFGVPGFTDHRELLARVRPDVVHVTTPHHQHVPIALAAIDAGVAVLSEKPVGHTVGSAETLLARASGLAVKVGVVLQNRYNPTSVAIRQALDGGAIGPIQGARAAVWWSRTPEYYAAAPWRGRWDEAGGGVLINQALHTLDLLLWFLGAPASVRGRADTLALGGAIEVEDTASIVLEHARGVRSTFFATNTHHRNDDVELELAGRDGTLRLAGGETHLVTDGAATLLATDTQASGQRSYWGRGHALQIADFHARLADPEPFWIDLATGIAPLRVLREVYRQSGLLPAGQEL